MLHFEGRKVYIDKLKRLLPKWWKYAANILTQFSFFINLLLRVPINGRKYRLEKQQSVRIIRIRITGRIFNAQSAYFSGETCFARINRMFELRIIRHSNYEIMNSTVWSVIRLNSLILKESCNYQCVSKKKTTKIDSMPLPVYLLLSSFCYCWSRYYYFSHGSVLFHSKRTFFGIKIHWTVYPHLQLAAMIKNILTKKIIYL